MPELFSRAGFFRELHDGRGLPSIRDAVRSERHPNEARIVAYLDDGLCLAACGGVQRDVLDPSPGRYTSPDMMTDGVWLWPRDLCYYVAAHGVEVPAEFVEHMRLRGWVIPTVSEAEVRALCDRLKREWDD